MKESTQPASKPAPATQPAADSEVQAAKAKEKFDSLFGDDVKRVIASADTLDDTVLAGRLLNAARTTRADPALAALLCENAYTLGCKHTSGYATAAEAMQLLAAVAPDRKLECLDKVVAARRYIYGRSKGAEREEALDTLLDAILAAADARTEADDIAGAINLARNALLTAARAKSPHKEDIQAKIKQFDRLRATAGKIRLMKARLKARPDDEYAQKQLLWAYLVERDDPAKAAKYINEKSGAEMRKYIPLAARKLDEIKEAECLAMALWYRGLAARTQPPGKTAMLRRAVRCYRHCLTGKGADDSSRKDIALALTKVEQELAKIGDPVTGLGVWTDVIRLVDPKQDAVGGKWTRRRKKLVLEDFKHHYSSQVVGIMLPVTPRGSYELSIKFVPSRSLSRFYVVFPTEVKPVAFEFSGYMKGLVGIHGRSLLDPENKTRVQWKGLVANQRYTLNIKVLHAGPKATITAHLNGRPCVRWQGPKGELTGSGFRLPTGFGLCAGASCCFYHVKVRMLSGELKLLRPAKK